MQNIKNAENQTSFTSKSNIRMQQHSHRVHPYTSLQFIDKTEQSECTIVQSQVRAGFNNAIKMAIRIQ